MARFMIILALALAGLVVAGPAAADGDSTALTVEPPPGRPKIVLDRLDFPESVDNHWYYRKVLREVLRREVRRVIWGAGTGDTITYRYQIDRLTFAVEEGVLRVRCSATGRLPKGKTARGSLVFSGDPQQKNAVARRVMEIVARGVISRLAEMERERRGVHVPED